MDREQKRKKQLLSLIASGGTDKELIIMDAIHALEDKVDEGVPSLMEIIARMKGDKGDSPTGEELISLIRPLISTPEKGHTPTDEEILSLIKPLIPEVKNGETPSDSRLLSLIEPLIPEINSTQIAEEASRKAHENIMPILPTLPQLFAEMPNMGVPIRDALEGLEDEERLDKKAIKGLESFIQKEDLDRAIGILDQRTSFLINKVSALASQGTSGGGTIGGSIAATQVAFGSGVNTITGSSNFTYDGTNLTLQTGSIFKGQYSNLAGSAYINPNGSAVFATGTVIIDSAGNLTATSFTGNGSGLTGLPWTRSSGTLFPTTTSDRVLIGGSVDDTTSILQVTGTSYFTGNMGVGTATPDFPLTVVSDNGIPTGNGYSQVKVSSGQSEAGITLVNSGTGGSTYNFVSTNDGSGVGGGRFLIVDATGVTVPFTILSSNVGIGTLTPTALFDVGGHTTIDSNGNVSINGDGGVGGYPFNFHDRFGTDANLSIYGNIVSPFGMYIVSRDDANTLLQPLSIAFSTFSLTHDGSTKDLYIASDGKVGIGTASVGHMLDVAGDARIRGAFFDSADSAGTDGQVLTSTSSGTATAWATAPTIPTIASATNLLSGDGAGNASDSGINPSTVITVVASGNKLAQSGASTLCTATSPSAGSYEVGGYVDISAITAGTVSLVVDYNDNAGASKTVTIPLVQLAGTIVAASTAIADLSAVVTSIQTDGSANIVARVTFAGVSVTYSAYAYVKRIV